jgi:hypothetical protein
MANEAQPACNEPAGGVSAAKLRLARVILLGASAAVSGWVIVLVAGIFTA